MRLVKLSTREFANEDVLHTYFAHELPKRKGLFIFGKQVAENSLNPGETVLFSYRGNVRYVAEAKTGRMENTFLQQENYPYCFVIKLPVHRAHVSFSTLWEKLHAKAGLETSFKGQGWTKIPDNEGTKDVIEELLSVNISAPLASDVSDRFPAKVKCTVHRFIRDTETSREIKMLYENWCQVCGKRLEIRPGAFYAEAHHLQPLGGEHKGPDVQDNILCLCPNHHALFDYFAIALKPAKLRFNKHKLRQSFVEYHNAHFRLHHSGRNVG